MDFVLLGRLAQNSNDGLDRRAARFCALKLTNRDRRLWVEFQEVIDPALELLQSGWIALGSRLRKEIHNGTYYSGNISFEQQSSVYKDFRL